MLTKKPYSNFVKAASSTQKTKTISPIQSTLKGVEARRLYLEEVQEVKNPGQVTKDLPPQEKTTRKRKVLELDISDKDLFLTVQNNDINKLRQVLDNSPDKINTVDSYGWSLLMIACQASSIETVKELLKRDIDTSVRDKAGNSAQSLVIKNRNYALADILLNHKSSKSFETKHKDKHKKIRAKEFICQICSKKPFTDKQEHLSSTIHNINASKGRKIPANYVIPQTNRGYQLMVKVGWDKESGLGPDGSGTKYPIKTVQKKDRKGLGHDKKKEEKCREQTIKYINRKTASRDYQNSRQMEINFRREFY